MQQIAFGMLGYDFDSRAKHDSLLAQGVPVDDRLTLAKFFSDADNLNFAEDFIWTLDKAPDVPVAAFYPRGAFALQKYQELAAHLDSRVPIIIPGRIIGQADLSRNGVRFPL